MRGQQPVYGHHHRSATRLAAHRAGGAKYTRGRGPLHLVFQEQAPDRSAATRREGEIKALDVCAKAPDREPISLEIAGKRSNNVGHAGRGENGYGILGRSGCSACGRWNVYCDEED